MPQHEQEITQNDFYSIIQEIGGRISLEQAIKKCFELSQSYHKQELSKVLGEVGMELPTDEQVKDNYPTMPGSKVPMESGRSHSEILYRNAMRREGAFWALNKASLVIAAKNNKIEKIKKSLVLCSDNQEELEDLILEKDKLILEKDKLIKEQKEKLEEFKSMLEYYLSDKEDELKAFNGNTFPDHEWQKLQEDKLKLK